MSSEITVPLQEQEFAVPPKGFKQLFAMAPSYMEPYRPVSGIKNVYVSCLNYTETRK